MNPSQDIAVVHASETPDAYWQQLAELHRWDASELSRNRIGYGFDPDTFVLVRLVGGTFSDGVMVTPLPLSREMNWFSICNASRQTVDLVTAAMDIAAQNLKIEHLVATVPDDDARRRQVDEHVAAGKMWQAGDLPFTYKAQLYSRVLRTSSLERRIATSWYDYRKWLYVLPDRLESIVIAGRNIPLPAQDVHILSLGTRYQLEAVRGFAGASQESPVSASCYLPLIRQ